MGIFATRGRSVPLAAPEVTAELSKELEAVLPPGFAAVGEALASGADSGDACAVAGRELALAAVSLDEALAGLETTFWLVRGTQPTFTAARAVAGGWSEATLGYLHQLSCADPVTGLASLAHLQSRLPELYRGELRGRAKPRESHALVVVDLQDVVADSRDALMHGTQVGDVLTADLLVARVAETAGTVFAAGEATARLGRHRIVVLAERDDRIGRRVALLTTLLSGYPGARVWIEGLPDTSGSAAALLGELARA